MISVCGATRVLAHQQAKRIVKESIRSHALKLQAYTARELNAAAERNTFRKRIYAAPPMAVIRHNLLRKCRPRPQSGIVGDGDQRSGPQLSGESGPDLITGIGPRKSLFF